ncbi:MAG: gamma-glutamyltransferase [Chitinophagaceae bacterium]|nr:gamma-glutamyltransferase [Chitinophagaceae bacterium]
MHFNTKWLKKAESRKGAVVSAHPLATKAGILILEKGGNAVDAAIAVQLALAVVYPGAGNIGGGGFMVARLSNGELVAIDYREKKHPVRGIAICILIVQVMPVPTGARMAILLLVYPAPFPGYLLRQNMAN